MSESPQKHTSTRTSALLPPPGMRTSEAVREDLGRIKSQESLGLVLERPKGLERVQDGLDAVGER